jgi:hypothetical protein
MKRPLSWLTGFCLIGPLLAEPASDVPASPGPSGRFVFNLLPKSFQANPEVDCNVITEMTDEGRKREPVTPATPAYYISQPGGFAQLGFTSPAGEKPPAIERMEKVLKAALAQSGYVRASQDHPPTIVIIYSWGSYASAQRANDGDLITNEVLVNEMIDRARLIGGRKFSEGFIQALAEEGRMKEQERIMERSPASSEMRDLWMETRRLMGFNRFRAKSDKNRSLIEDTLDSIYFVVASAYDFTSATTDSKILLWRTKMTANSDGVALDETLPALITTAGPYFGKDMSEVEIVGQRLKREGTTKLGPLEVKEYDVKAAPPAREGKP